MGIKFINWTRDFFTVADKASLSTKKKPRSSSYDDETIQKMLKYYRVGDDYASLLKYIKSIGAHQEDLELV